jgi:hypothetical protein
MAKKQQSSHALLKGAAALTAIAGAYFLYGAKDAKKNRKVVKSWAVKAKGDVLEKMEKIQDITEGDYMKILDTVRARYEKTKNVTTNELNDLMKELKGHWKDISKAVKTPTKKVAKKK